MSAPRSIIINPSDILCDFLGLTAEEIGIFAAITFKMYAAGGAIPADELALSREFKVRPTSVRRLVQSLYEHRKLRLVAGEWVNDRVMRELRACRPPIPAAIRAAVFARDGYQCRYCGADRGPFELDHRLPWSRGGRHSVENLTVSCVPCNRSKGALTDEEWCNG